MVGRTSILAPEKPGRFRNPVLVGYVFEKAQPGWLRIGYEKT